MKISTTFNVSKNKIANAIAIFLIVSMTLTMVALPTALAHTPPTANTTYCYIAPAPSTIGVGQQMLIVWWLNAVPPTAAGAIGDRWNVYIDIIKPDATNDTFGPLTSDSVGGGYAIYTYLSGNLHLRGQVSWTNNNWSSRNKASYCRRYLYSQHKQTSLFHCTRRTNPDIRNTSTNRLLDTPSLRQ